MRADVKPIQTLKGTVVLGSGGAKYYEDLPDKPRINTVELSGDKSFEEIGLREITQSEIDDILFGGD